MFRALAVAIVISLAALGTSTAGGVWTAMRSLEASGSAEPANFPLPVPEGCPAGTYQGSSGDCVPSPNGDISGATAVCCDGSDSHSEHRSGTCSHHGGVCQWCPCGSTSGQSYARQDIIADNVVTARHT